MPMPTTAGSREEHGVLGHHPHVRRQGQLGRAADAGAVDLHDRGLGHLLQQVPDGEDRTAEGAQLPRVLGQGAQVREVHARREHRSVPAHHDDPYRGVVGRLLERLSEPPHELLVHRVALLRTRHDDVAHRAAILDLNQRHVGSPRSER
jgi:hypothetical protein